MTLYNPDLPRPPDRGIEMRHLRCLLKPQINVACGPERQPLFTLQRAHCTAPYLIDGEREEILLEAESNLIDKFEVCGHTVGEVGLNYLQKPKSVTLIQPAE